MLPRYLQNKILLAHARVRLRPGCSYSSATAISQLQLQPDCSKSSRPTSGSGQWSTPAALLLTTAQPVIVTSTGVTTTLAKAAALSGTLLAKQRLRVCPRWAAFREVAVRLAWKVTAAGRVTGAVALVNSTHCHPRPVKLGPCLVKLGPPPMRGVFESACGHWQLHWQASESVARTLRRTGNLRLPRVRHTGSLRMARGQRSGAGNLKRRPPLDLGQGDHGGGISETPAPSQGFEAAPSLLALEAGLVLVRP